MTRGSLGRATKMHRYYLHVFGQPEGGAWQRRRWKGEPAAVTGI